MNCASLERARRIGSSSQISEQKINQQMPDQIVITLEDGRMFPVYEGEPLSWILDNSFGEQQKGYPKARAVIRAMMVYRPEQLERERREMLKCSFDRMFGMNAKRMLDLIEEELAGAAQ